MTDHLKYGAGGHLLYGPNGHMVYDCGTGPVNTCNTCDPPIPDTLYATASGLAGSFAWANTKTTIWFDSMRGACYWTNYPDQAAGEQFCVIVWSGSQWIGAVYGAYADCQKQWLGPTTACDPTGSYTENTCTDSGCDDTDSCEDSAGATFAVSLT